MAVRQSGPHERQYFSTSIVHLRRVTSCQIFSQEEPQPPVSSWLTCYQTPVCMVQSHPGVLQVFYAVVQR